MKEIKTEDAIGSVLCHDITEIVKDQRKGPRFKKGHIIKEEDIEVLKKRKLYAISNPGSNTKLASGTAPVSRYLKEGIPVALGTDGPASNNCLDMFREMFLVTGLAKLKEEDAAAVDAMEVLKMATGTGLMPWDFRMQMCLPEGNWQI